eukprot:TRINITY_DN1790_c0_g2_i2.p1 TRINITY_DN1790_c0_g2~~TRINITY_DN1790_c0_g2_i2.p1  ORF type:complete len:570 (+),score=120.58 TRINITY_DN1790_c0_g2_i2:123-1832(+)
MSSSHLKRQQEQQQQQGSVSDSDGSDNNSSVGKVKFSALYALSNILQTSFGPFGSDKLIIDKQGNPILTNDGATILSMLPIQNPLAKVLVDISLSQDQLIGDGTTSVVLLACSLIKEAENILREGDSSQSISLCNSIIDTYFECARISLQILKDIAIPVENDREILLKVASTSLNSKGLSSSSRTQKYISSMVVQAVEIVKGKLENISFHTVLGGSVLDSVLVNGLALQRKLINGTDEPLKIQNPKIMLANFNLGGNVSDLGGKKSHSNILGKKNEEVLFCHRIAKTGVNVIFTTCYTLSSVADLNSDLYVTKDTARKEDILPLSVVKQLSDLNIFVVEGVSVHELSLLQLATGARVLQSSLEMENFDDLAHIENVIGQVGCFEEKRLSGSNTSMVMVTECKASDSCSIILRGGSITLIEETQRSMRDALCVVKGIISSSFVLPGAGAVDAEIEARLSENLDSIPANIKSAFCKSILTLPKYLALNSGLDVLDTIANLKMAHANKSSEKNQTEQSSSKFQGINVHNGKISNVYDMGILEPLQVKTGVITLAVEAATKILRIDDIIIPKR